MLRRYKSPGLKASSRRITLSLTLLLPVISTGPKCDSVPGSAVKVSATCLAFAAASSAVDTFEYG